MILPITGTAHEPFLAGDYVSFLLDHAILVGLVIALITGPVTAATRRRPFGVVTAAQGH